MSSCRGAPKFLREYYYFLNQRGQLFHIYDIEGLLSVSKLPTGPTFLRDPKFLDFFFQRIRPNPVFFAAIAEATERRMLFTRWTQHAPWEAWEHHSQDALRRLGIIAANKQSDAPGSLDTLATSWCPWVSVCGDEGNFLISEDAPIVFSDLQWDANPSAEISRDSASNGSHASLVFGGSMREVFRPGTLRCSRDGRLYHPVAGTQFAGGGRAVAKYWKLSVEDVDESPPLMGLVGAQVGLKLGLDFVCEDTNDDGHFVIEWFGQQHVIPFLN